MRKLKSLISKILLITLVFGLVQFQPALTYASNDNTPYADALNQLGVFQGTDKGYELERTPTRIEGLILFIRLLGEQDDLLSIQTLTTAFDDVPDWGSSYAEYAYAKGYTKGIGNRQFGSNQEMQANSYVTYLLRSLGYSTDNDDFQWASALDDAVRLGVISNEDAMNLKSGVFTRGDVAYLSYKTLQAEHKQFGMTLYDVLKDKGKFKIDLPQVDSIEVTVEIDPVSGVYNEALSKQRENEIIAVYDAMTIPVSSATYYMEKPVTEAPYNAGKLTSDYIQTAIDTINLVRMIAYLPDNITDDSDWNELSQHAALANYVNGQLSHYPVQPEGMSDSMHALAVTGARTSNIYYGQDMARPSELRNTVLEYMDDSDKYNIKHLGHRRWLLHPNMTKAGVGYVSDGQTTYSALRVFDDQNRGFLNVEDSADYVAWPSANAFPTTFFEPHMAWLLSLNSFKYDNTKLDELQVTLKNETTGLVTIFKNDERGLTPSGTKKYFNINTFGYGVPFAVIFRPDTYKIKANDIYSVYITGLYKRNGEKTEIKYVTRFFDM